MPAVRSILHPTRRTTLAALAAIWVATFAWNGWKPLPAGAHEVGPWRLIEDSEVELLVDSSTMTVDGQRAHDQQIFDAVFAAIAGARRAIVLDFFLWNSAGQVDGGDVLRPLSRELTDALLAQRARFPELRVLALTDPINEAYGGAPSALFDELRAAGIEIVITKLGRLRDSNPLYSTTWRLLVAWWQHLVPERGWLPHPLGADATGSAPDVSLRAWLRLLNFKANHRKVIVCDDGAGGWRCIVTSANPHDPSSAHSNIALSARGPVAIDAALSEFALAEAMGWRDGSGLRALLAQDVAVDGSRLGSQDPVSDDARRPIALRLATEGGIESETLAALAEAGAGDRVSLAMFYLSDRDIVAALLAASVRGATVRLVLDPNRDAFGRTKGGVPNRQVADELVHRSEGAIQVRWYATHGEQFHTKLTLVASEGSRWATLGSANFTRRNLDDLNLEANLVVRARGDSNLAQDLDRTFETLWTGEGGRTLPYASFEDRSRAKRLRYFLMEWSGLSTF